jgi:hypothetical protein
MTRTFVLAVLVTVVLPCLAVAAPGPKKEPLDAKVRELRKEQIKALQEQLSSQIGNLKIGKDSILTFIEAVRDLGEAELDLAETREAELAALSGVVKRLQVAEDEMEQMRMAGLMTKAGVAQMRAARLKAEIQLEKKKR